MKTEINRDELKERDREREKDLNHYFQLSPCDNVTLYPRFSNIHSQLITFRVQRWEFSCNYAFLPYVIKNCEFSRTGYIPHFPCAQ